MRHKLSLVFILSLLIGLPVHSWGEIPEHKGLGDIFNEFDSGDVYQDPLETYKNQNPSPAINKLIKADKLEKQNKIDETIKLIKESIKLEPKLWFGYYNLAGIYYRSGELDPAEKNIKQAINFEKETSNSENLYGLILYKKGKQQLAIKAYQSAIKKDPNNSHAHYNLAYNYFIQKKSKLAITAAKKAIQLDSSMDRPHFLLASLSFLNGDLLSAKSSYQAVLKLVPNDFLSRAMLGYLYAQTGMFDAAHQEFKTVLSSKTDNSLARSLSHVGQGSLYFRERKLDEAQTAIKKGLQLNPQFAKAHAQLGTIDLMRKNFKDAELRFQTALNLDSNDVTANMGIAAVYAVNGNIDKSMDYYSKVKILAPMLTQPYLVLATIHENKGNYAQAITEIKAGLKINPNDVALKNQLKKIKTKKSK